MLVVKYALFPSGRHRSLVLSMITLLIFWQKNPRVIPKLTNDLRKLKS